MAKLHPLLQEKWDALGNNVHRELFDLAATMFVPFWWHGPTPADGAIYNNGTLCLLDTGARVVGVTAWHVYEKYLAHLNKGVPVTGLVSQVTPQNLVVEVDYARLSDADGPEGNVVSVDPRGTSGGPVYRVIDSAKGPGLEIIGFIYEQSELNRFVLARHADFIRPDGAIVM